MPRTCTVCGHPQRAEIDTYLLRSETLRSIVARCSVSMGSLIRHRDRHLPVTLAHAKEARETVMGENLMEEARSLHARAVGILEKAEKAGQLETALKAIREVRGILELLAKLDGQLEDRGVGHVRVEVIYIDKTPSQGGNGAPNTLDISHTPKRLTASRGDDITSRGLCGDQDDKSPREGGTL